MVVCVHGMIERDGSCFLCGHMRSTKKFPRMTAQILHMHTHFENTLMCALSCAFANSLCLFFFPDSTGKAISITLHMARGRQTSC